MFLLKCMQPFYYQTNITCFFFFFFFLASLDSEHIGDIVRALKPVSHHWKMLGLFLGVRYYELEAIEAGKSNPTLCLMDMIDKWIKSDCECTSKHIEAALKDINVTVKRS